MATVYYCSKCRHVCDGVVSTLAIPEDRVNPAEYDHNCAHCGASDPTEYDTGEAYLEQALDFIKPMLSNPDNLTVDMVRMILDRFLDKAGA